MVECQLPKLKVASSSLVARSKKPASLKPRFRFRSEVRSCNPKTHWGLMPLTLSLDLASLKLYIDIKTLIGF